MPPTNNIFTIPPGTHFLRRLAQFILKDEALNASSENHDPLQLSRTTIYLPTRRAIRALRNEFSTICGNNSLFLPTLRTLGDEEDELDLLSAKSKPPQQVIDPVTRQILLARLVKRWVEMIGEETRHLFGDEDIAIPSSTAEALWLAREIAELIDQMETEEISWNGLKDLVSNKQEYANWWQLTLDFLQIATKNWPLILDEINAIDPAVYRRQTLDFRTQQLHANPPSGPIFAAGSTGSIPATARFLKAISELPNGKLILPGLDASLDQESWQIIRGSEESATTITQQPRKSSACEDHPQYGLVKLLNFIGVSRNDVVDLGTNHKALQDRSHLVSTAMMPSGRTDHWHQITTKFEPEFLEHATSDITLVDAPAERQEALAIALILREQVMDPQIQAALVTPDRNLARRVTSELRRFSLNIDDSGGVSLASTNPAIFVRLMISVATQPIIPANLASFIKHPFLFPGQNSNEEINLAHLFEICLLRGALKVPSAGQFQAAIVDYRAQTTQNAYLPKLIANVDDSTWEGLENFCHRIDSSLSELVEACLDKRQVSLSLLMDCAARALVELTTNNDNTSEIFNDEDGAQLAQIFEILRQPNDYEFFCDPKELPPVFDALIAGKVVRKTGNTHPRISILGPLEARLQSLDCVILGSLNEGTWPANYDSGPFLNRPMKSAINLATPERRTGLSAHDFEQLLGTPKVYLTRAGRVDNAPAIPSRWLQRLTTVCDKQSVSKMRQRGEKYLHWAKLIDEPEEISSRTIQPCPAPPIISRPKSLSVTEIETWIRDPYAIYARRILNLTPLRPIGILDEPPLKGTILHDAAADFISAKPGLENTKRAVENFISLTVLHMKANKIPDHIRAIWLPRFAEIAKQFIANEQIRSRSISASHCEIDGKIQVPNTDFYLRGRADRLDISTNGEVHILDYKTGTNPTAKMARTLAPQLALEGAMAMAGGFSNIGKIIPISLEYIRLRPRFEFKVDRVDTDIHTAADLARLKLEELQNLIKRYDDPQQGYLSRFAVELSQNVTADFDHLARVREWSWGQEEDVND